MKKMKELLSEIRFRDDSGNIMRLSDIQKEYQDTKEEEVVTEDENIVAEAAPLPAEVKRYMSKFTDSLKGAGLNRMKQAAVIAGVVDALGIDPKELMQLIQRVKRGM